MNLTDPSVSRADVLKERLAEQLSAIADRRLRRWLDTFTARWPRLRVEILFGNGSEFIAVGGVSVQPWEMEKGSKYHRSLAGLHAALMDVWNICDGYKLTCPNDVKAGPKAQRFNTRP